MLKKGLLILFLLAAMVLAGGVLILINTDIEETEFAGGKYEKVTLFGKVSAERTYDREGSLDGITRIFFRSGELRSEWNFKKGERHGDAKIYYDDGNVRYEDYYENDRRLSRVEYDREGNITAERNYES